MLIWILTALTLIFSGCGRNTAPTSSQSLEKVTQTQFSNNAVILKKQISQCDENKGQRPNYIELKVFLNGFLLDVFDDFYVFEPRIISKIVYGETAEYVFSEGKNYVVNYQAPSVLDICSQEKEFMRESLENAALISSYYIRKTNREFKRIIPDITVTPITLNVSPSIIQSSVERNRQGKLVKKSFFMTDNAFYHPAESMISFLPHSRELKAHLNLNFWEVPMVASHEYGHHLFQMIYEGQNVRTPEGCFNSSHNKISKISKQQLRTQRTVEVGDIINFYNEGFADLITWYTLSWNERSVRGVPCLEVTRDIGSSRFYDGKPKKFSEEALRSFFSQYQENNFRSCEFVNYQTVHAMGAVFAHTADQILSYVLVNDEEKLAVAVEWVKFLRAGKNKFGKMPPEAFLKVTYAELVRLAVNKSGLVFNHLICNKVGESFPGLEMPECLL